MPREIGVGNAQDDKDGDIEGAVGLVSPITSLTLSLLPHARLSDVDNAYTRSYLRCVYMGVTPIER